MQGEEQQEIMRKCPSRNATFFTLLHCFSPALFKAAVYVAGQNLVDAMTMIIYPKTLCFYFQKQ